MKLAEDFKGSDSDGCGEVKGAQRGGRETGEGDAVGIADFGVQPIGGSVALIAKKQAIPRCEIGVPKRLPCVGGEEPAPLGGRGVLAESAIIVMDMQVQMFPVIHTTAFQLAVADREAEGSDQVKSRIHPCAEPTHIAGILRDFRIEKGDVEPRILHGS